MLAHYAKKGLQRLLGLFGLELRRKNSRSSLIGVLTQARQIGFVPQTVLDVGAAWGSFTKQCHSVFPQAKYLLIEPLVEYQAALQQLASTLPGVDWIAAVAASQPGTLTLNVHPDLMGSSLLLEQEELDVNGIPRSVRSVTLESLVAERNLRPPFLLKLDVQGVELEVLAGATTLLPQVEFVLLEVSLFEFFAGGPLVHEVVAFMKANGFVLYDLGGRQYRPLDNALAQLDMVFVREKGMFRRHHAYATAAQRQEQNKKFRLEA